MASGLMKLEFHYEAFDSIRKSDGVKDRLRQWGEQMVNQAGPDDFEYSEYEGARRARVTVRPKTRRGARMEAADKVLTTAFGGLS